MNNYIVVDSNDKKIRIKAGGFIEGSGGYVQFMRGSDLTNSEVIVSMNKNCWKYIYKEEDEGVIREVALCSLSTW